ncbi:MAG: SDR family NAD(P)-dependent oxidoreductase [Gemmatimonadetes bacterium]|nr:SDR family NAD(P)-dependent oxidoreductase [Gemmatimonadota bacterium]
MAPAARRVTLITGAAHGLGWALAQEAAGRGDALVLADRNAETLTTRVTALGGIVPMPGTALPPEGPLHIIGVPGDVTDSAHQTALVAAAVGCFGRIDRLIHNAGITHRSPARVTRPEVIRRVMEVDYHAPVALTHLALPYLRETRGSLVAVSSMAGWMPLPGRAGYGAAKAALTQYFEVLRLELASEGIHVLLVHPSFLATTIERHALGADGAPARHPRSTTGRIRTAEAEARRILDALDARRSTVRPDLWPSIGALLWRLWPGLYRRLITRRFAGEL